MKVYIVIEERDEYDDLKDYHKYEITDPWIGSLVCEHLWTSRVAPVPIMYAARECHDRYAAELETLLKGAKSVPSETGDER